MTHRKEGNHIYAHVMQEAGHQATECLANALLRKKKACAPNVHQALIPHFILLLKIRKSRLFKRKDEIFLVRRKGLEPPTYWFVASHSIQLSYRRISAPFSAPI